jgi:hypothetical protein
MQILKGRLDSGFTCFARAPNDNRYGIAGTAPGIPWAASMAAFGAGGGASAGAVRASRSVQTRLRPDALAA